MAGVAVADGFLGRWSQRKQAVREGKPVQDPAIAPPAIAPPAAAAGAGPGAEPARAPAPLQGLANTGGAAAMRSEAAEPAEPAPALSLDDAAQLTSASDFRPFVAREVAPEVRNAAFKKLFADPHYNVMDRLDIYIDDYSQPDPLPLSMLRQMASAQFMNLVEAPATPPVATPQEAAAPVKAGDAPTSFSSNAGALSPAPAATPDSHDHTDL